jgi:hypothetical protein
LKDLLGKDLALEGRQAILRIGEAENDHRCRSLLRKHNGLKGVIEVLDELEPPRIEDLKTQKETIDHYDSPLGTWLPNGLDLL